MSDPFDGVEPIGQRAGSPVERRLRRERAAANQHDLVSAHHEQREVVQVGDPAAPRTRRKRDGSVGARTPVLTNDEVLAKVSGLFRKFARAAGKAQKPGDIKNMAAAAAIMADKWLLASGRPTTVHAFAAYTAENRAALAALAARLVAVQGGRG